MAGQRLLVAGSASVDGEPHVVCERSEIPLRGDHNVLNVLAACAISGVNRCAAGDDGRPFASSNPYHTDWKWCGW